MLKTRFAVLVVLCLAVLVPGAAALGAAVNVRARSAPAAVAARACGPTSMQPRRNNLRLLARVTLCLINRQRAAHRLRALHSNASLTRAASGHSQDMVNRGYFSHLNLRGVNPFQRILQHGYAARDRACAMGENIAAGTGRDSTPAAIVRMWMNSPEHRANILDGRYHDTGLGVAFGFPGARGYRGATYTEDFGGHC